MAQFDSIVSFLENIDPASFNNEGGRVRVRDALYKALRRTQTPWEIVWEHNWTNGATYASVKTLLDIGVFQKWAAAGGGPITISELAKLTLADAQLLRRMMRQIAGQFLVLEVKEDTYNRTPWAKSFGDDPLIHSAYGSFFSQNIRTMFQNLPYYLKSIEYRDPKDNANGNWQFWTKQKLSFFDVLARNDALKTDFHNTMSCHTKYCLDHWPELYPTDSIASAAKVNRSLVVDIGGSVGHDLERFRSKHPDIPNGSLVLQDLPEVLEGLSCNKAIQLQPYNFFTVQPNKGATAYYMHQILHDWPDVKAVQILANIAHGMEKGYSRLLIHESLITSTSADPRVTTTDIAMMACVAAKERTEEEWRILLAKAGLHVTKIWRKKGSIDCIIEAMLY